MVLLIGGNSFIGKHIVERLCESQQEVIATYNNKCELLTGLSDKFKNLKIKKLNLVSRGDFEDLPDGINCAILVAANLGNKSYVDPEIVDVNVIGALNLLRFSQERKIKKIINLSSLSVHGQIIQKLVSQLTPLNPNSLYGFSKLAAERILEHADINMSVYSIRLPGVLGLGAHSAWIPSLIEKLLKNQEVCIHSKNAQFNNALDAYDLADFIINLHQIDYGVKRAAFPLGASTPMRIEEVVGFMRDSLKSTSPLKYYVATQQLPFIIDSEYAVQNFQYKYRPMRSILSRYIEYVKTNRS
jgi:nucleoside-diphosphate-sugar epimerase